MTTFESEMTFPQNLSVSGGRPNTNQHNHLCLLCVQLHAVIAKPLMYDVQRVLLANDELLYVCTYVTFIFCGRQLRVVCALTTLTL